MPINNSKTATINKLCGRNVKTIVFFKRHHDNFKKRVNYAKEIGELHDPDIWRITKKEKDETLILTFWNQKEQKKSPHHPSIFSKKTRLETLADCEGHQCRFCWYLAEKLGMITGEKRKWLPATKWAELSDNLKWRLETKSGDILLVYRDKFGQKCKMLMGAVKQRDVGFAIYQTWKIIIALSKYPVNEWKVVLGRWRMKHKDLILTNVTTPADDAGFLTSPSTKHLEIDIISRCPHFWVSSGNCFVCRACGDIKGESSWNGLKNAA